MVIVPGNEVQLFISQGDHAHLANDILSLWRADGLPENPRRRSILHAAREHDNGWREADAAPRVDPATGRAYDFRTLPRTDRIEIWQRGVTRPTGDPYAALLVAHHALALHADRRGEPSWQELFDALDERREELLDELGAEAAATADADYRFIALADAVSLVACERPAAPWRVAGTEIAWSDGAVRLAPFPLAGATTFEVAVRRLPERPYQGDADLIGELAAARWEKLALRLAPPPETA